MDAGFVSLIGCGVLRTCRSLELGDYRKVPVDPPSVRRMFKMLIDVDGMGFSSRFLYLLGLGSAVVKNTIYVEYYSDWLTPWYHYLPLSDHYSEIWNLWAYFLGHKLKNDPSAHDRKGARQLQEIATQSDEWRSTVGRTIDMELYIWRLMLEWSRLWTRDD